MDKWKIHETVMSKEDFVHILMKEIAKIIELKEVEDGNIVDALDNLKLQLKRYLLLNLKEGFFISDNSKDFIDFIKGETVLVFNRHFSLSFVKGNIDFCIEGKRVITKSTETLYAMEE